MQMQEKKERAKKVKKERKPHNEGDMEYMRGQIHKGVTWGTWERSGAKLGHKQKKACKGVALGKGNTCTYST